MGMTIRFFMVLGACMLLASQAFANDWSTILPPQEGQPDPAKVIHSEKTLRVGELVTLPLPGSRSHICPVELDGDAVKLVAHEIHESVTLQALKPGKATLRIFRKFWRDPDVRESNRLVEVVSLTVLSGFRKNFPTEKQEAEKSVPVPVQKDGMEWEGHLSLQEEELVTVVTDKREWSALWQRAFAAPAPEVDFENYGVACVFLGFNADWLYGIEFGEPRIEHGLKVIPYDLVEIILELQGPFRAGGQYHMKAFERNKGYGIGLERASGSRK